MTAANTGLYSVTVTDEFGCMDSTYTYIEAYFALFCPPNQTISCNTYLDNYAPGIAQGDYSVLESLGSDLLFAPILSTRSIR